MMEKEKDLVNVNYRGRYMIYLPLEASWILRKERVLLRDLTLKRITWVESVLKKEFLNLVTQYSPFLMN